MYKMQTFNDVIVKQKAVHPDEMQTHAKPKREYVSSSDTDKHHCCTNLYRNTTRSIHFVIHNIYFCTCYLCDLNFCSDDW